MLFKKIIFSAHTSILPSTARLCSYTSLELCLLSCIYNLRLSLFLNFRFFQKNSVSVSIWKHPHSIFASNIEVGCLGSVVREIFAAALGKAAIYDAWLSPLSNNLLC